VKVRMQKLGLSEATVVADVRTTVVYDQYDQPILVVSTLERGHLSVTSAKDPNFAKVLEALGIGLNATIKVLA